MRILNQDGSLSIALGDSTLIIYSKDNKWCIGKMLDVSTLVLGEYDVKEKVEYVLAEILHQNAKLQAFKSCNSSEEIFLDAITEYSVYKIPKTIDINLTNM